MLNKLYELAHADTENPHITDTLPDNTHSGRVTVYHSDHRFNFEERYSRHGDWEAFKVTLYPDAHKRPDMSFLFK